MKKIILGFALVLCILALSGCGSKKLICTKDESLNGIKGTAKINIAFSGNNISKINLNESFEVGEAFSSFMTFMKQSVEEQLKDYKGNGFSTNVDIEGNKLISNVEFDLSKMDSGSKKKISLVNVNAKYDDVKKQLTTAGYTCK